MQLIPVSFSLISLFLFSTREYLHEEVTRKKEAGRGEKRKERKKGKDRYIIGGERKKKDRETKDEEKTPILYIPSTLKFQPSNNP
jgi:hypothetical protein